MRKQKWGSLTEQERDRALLSELRCGRTIQSLAERLDTHASIVEEHLERLRKGGGVLCTNKVWYRKDIPLRPPEPRTPRPPTEKEAKFLVRQGRLF